MEKLHGYHENRWFKKSKKAGKSKNLPIYKCASPSYHKSSQGAGNGVAPHKAYEKGENGKMKWKNKIFSLLLAGTMAAACLTGCAGETASGSTPVAGSSVPPTSTAESGEPVQATYPLSEEPVTLRVYMKDSSGKSLDFNEIAGYKAAFEKLGVNVEFIIPATGSEADQFNLMIASGEYPDIILWDFSSTPMSLPELVNSGVLIDMDEYIRQYAPNYMKLLNEREEYLKEATADNGHLLSMYAFNEGVPVSGGPTIRADLLEKYNLDIPVTINDWTEVMTALKENGVAYPMICGKQRDGSIWFDGFLSAYKTSNVFCLDDKTGEVVFGPATDNFKEYVAQLNAWFEAGLIDPEFSSLDGTAMNARLTDGRSASAPNMQLSYHIGNITKVARETNPEFEFVGCPWPVLNEEDQPSYVVKAIAYSGKQAAITSACEDPVIATQFLDYFYSEEGQDFLCWGIEGESYSVNEDGTKQFTDGIMNNPDGKNPQEAILAYATPQYNFANVMLNEPYAQIITTLPEQLSARNTWLDADAGVALPRVTVAADVQSDYSMLMNDIDTYVQEMYVKFISGQASLDTDWESYVNTLNGMGLETATQYMADAYAKYQQR